MKQIAIIIDRQYIDAHFCFRELIASLANSGFHVTLFYIPTERSPKFDSNDRIKLKVFSKSKLGTLKLFFQLLAGNFNYHTVIVTPQWPLFWASFAKIKFKLVCLSDEVNTTDPNDYSSAQTNQGFSAKKWKNREIIAHQKCDATIALDQTRYDLVKQINNLSYNHSYFIIPNAPSAKLASKPQVDFYRTSFNVKQNETVVLHSGGLQWNLLKDLTTIKLDPNIKLILQARTRGKEQFPSSVLISDKYIDYEELIPYAKGADIGLLLYDEFNPEEKRNGNTAGKLGLYLGAGLPIIGCNLKIFEWLEKEQCGIRIDNLNQLNDAIKKINANYSSYSNNSKRIFEKKYEYTEHFKPFEKWLKS